ncbi:MAG: deoxyribodipyrimidine photo-lyase [Gammaproteobacteria bacterium]|uniref:Deoxyribodipyrimidine photo-lyase n=1 Tax=Vreelandella venusta TaxID=44935 RepID=A0ABX2BC73_9GAMM|nr:deoxyribodipyrimidine photo-lyase [Halomonas venusta]AZM94302.1 deoxyribodipyrimidine photo-lyase [Halomonas venusta]MBR9924548.1 deoxyribodipyrimidine photo-lyase [Gammaproteobacteria bacterium]NPT31722.1 deoxyribodipyrimidine photo-lyase [Halomonas venusta]WAM52252.1 deoxyribodipyrimidine photo-lyase [Halomonas venusta]
MNLQLVWLRSDLRIHDNSALAAAAAKGPVVAVFLRSVAQWQTHGHGATKIDFWARSVAALKASLNGLNIPLLHRDIDHYDEAAQVLLDIAREHQITQLHFNYEYALNEQRRDQSVLDAFQQAEITVQGHHDAVAFAPGSLLTGKGDYYGVFTPFSKAWHKQVTAQQLALRDTPGVQPPLAIDSDPLPAPPSLDNDPVDKRLWPAGEEAASDNLERFLRFRGRHYKQQRDFPNVRGTSELSPYLALGMISYRQCLQAVMSENSGHLADGDAGLTSWVNELIWREFYQHVAVGFPQVCRHQPFQEHTKQLRWRDDDKGFQAWCEGRTGYPIVDAAMRQLVTTGWMHNRLRMVTAMFLSKHLLIDWRRGEAFFMRHLIDGEFCANNGGWQWAASTGTDAAPYFRIFNPTTQSTRFDPEGEFIAHWLPELKSLPKKARHAPPQDMLNPTDYPAPIVDHKAARQRALDAFKALSK